MVAYVVSGKFRSGKTLVCVGRARDYLRAGRRVAGNVDLFLDRLMPGRECFYDRLPDFPSGDDIAALGAAYEGDYNEDKNGLLILDEAMAWLNSRRFNDAGRLGLIRSFQHMGKLGWDLMLIAHGKDSIDKQVQEIAMEHWVGVRRVDRMRIPWLGFKLPLVHVGKVYLAASGSGARDEMRVATWVYRGKDLYNCYDTRQVFGRVTASSRVHQFKAVLDAGPFRRPLKSSSFRPITEHFVIRHGVMPVARDCFLVASGGYPSFLVAHGGLQKPLAVLAGSTPYSSKGRAA